MRYLKESGTPLLSIPLPEIGSRHAYFLRRDVACQVHIPSRKTLRQAAERRIVADRRKRWARFRLAKEAALGNQCGESQGFHDAQATQRIPNLPRPPGS